MRSDFKRNAEGILGVQLEQAALFNFIGKFVLRRTLELK